MAKGHGHGQWAHVPMANGPMPVGPWAHALRDKVLRDKVLRDKVLRDKVLRDNVLRDRLLREKVLKDKVLSDKVLSDVLRDKFLSDRRFSVISETMFPKQLLAVGVLAVLVKGPWNLRQCGRRVAELLFCAGCGLREGRCAPVHAKRLVNPFSTDTHNGSSTSPPN